jgi:hypothetical protein
MRHLLHSIQSVNVPKKLTLAVQYCHGSSLDLTLGHVTLDIHSEGAILVHSEGAILAHSEGATHRPTSG